MRSVWYPCRFPFVSRTELKKQNNYTILKLKTCLILFNWNPVVPAEVLLDVQAPLFESVMLTIWSPNAFIGVQLLDVQGVYEV